ncbi:MAG: M48 family metalloprotease [Eubacteriales bacterium]|nr:M48 family metalloprotease [Eubacteriales bacterium]
MRIVGAVKISGILLMDFLIVYYTMGVEAALFITGGVMLFGWLGEYLTLLKEGAVQLNCLNEYEKTKLRRVHNCLRDAVKRVSGADISGLKLHVIPSDNINAYAYGFNNVAITRGMLNCCDETTLCAVLGHEISHTLNMDAVAGRMIFANITLVLAGLTAGSFITVSFMWILFIMLCALGICGGFISVFLFSGAKELVKGIFTVIQYIVLFVYKLIMGIASRGNEFRADRFSCQLGYGSALSYFLTRFVESQQNQQRTLTDIIYASHPATYRRVQRIEQTRTTAGHELEIRRMQK